MADADTIEKVNKYSWPDPFAYDFKVLPDKIRIIDPQGDHAILIAECNPFETCCNLIGLEKTMLMLFDKPEIIHAVMHKIIDFFIAYIHQILKSCCDEVDLVFCADDLASQKSQLISAQLYREMLMPYHKKLFSAIHGYGKKVLFHSDGAIVGLLDDLIEAGIDCLEAVQVDCENMEPASLKERFGPRLSFHGGVSVQRLLPYATPDEVYNEVRYLCNVLGKGGGYICAPTHAIQAGTPPVNVIAMAEGVIGQSITSLR